MKKIIHSISLTMVFLGMVMQVNAAATVCPPENLHVSGYGSAGTNKVTLQWDSPGWGTGCRYTGASTIKMYHLYLTQYSSAGAPLQKILVKDPGTGGIETIDILPNVRYDAALTVEYGDGAVSSETTLSNIIIADEANTCSVQSVSASHLPSDPDGVMVLDWNESCPLSNSLRPLGYTIYANNSSVISPSTGITSEGGRYSTKVTLEKGTYYQINVYPRYTNTVNSSKGAYTSFTTSGTKPVVEPSPLTNTSGLSFSSPNLVTGGVTLKWNLPTAVPVNESYRLGAYEVSFTEYDAAGKAKAEVFQTTLSPVTTYFLSPLKKDTKYTITLKGKSSAGKIVSIDTLTDILLKTSSGGTVVTNPSSTNKYSYYGFAHLKKSTRYALSVKAFASQDGTGTPLAVSTYEINNIEDVGSADANTRPRVMSSSNPMQMSISGNSLGMEGTTGVTFYWKTPENVNFTVGSYSISYVEYVGGSGQIVGEKIEKIVSYKEGALVTSPIVSTPLPFPVKQSSPVDTTKYIFQVTQRDILIRGYVQSVNGDVFTVKTFGSTWTVKIVANTEFVSVDGERPALRVGDYIGVRGKLTTNEDFGFIADALRNRTLYP